jgi:hypothetical protein
MLLQIELGGSMVNEKIGERNMQGEVEEETKNIAIKQNKIQSEIETRLSPSLRPPIKYDEIFKEIRKLGEKEITLQEIADTRIVDSILAYETPNKILKYVEWRYEKWLAKRGKELLETSRERMWKYLEMKETIDRMARYINGAYGFVSDEAMKQIRFMYHLFSKLQKTPQAQWIEVANQELKIWLNKPKVDPQALRSSAHILLKLMYKELTSF